MAKYRITSLPGYTKRIPLSKAQFGGLNKFLEGGDPCPPEKQVYPQFSKFGCISSSQYNKLVEQTKNNLLKQELYKKTKLDKQKALRESWSDPELFKKLMAEWKIEYPGENSSCPNGKCPEYDLVLDPEEIPEIPEEIPEIPELSLSGYPDAPIYNPTDTDMIMPTIGIGPGETKSRKNRGILMNGKGQNYKHTTYRQTKDLDFGTREATRPIPKMIQKFTGYDRKFMEGYEDKEGNYIPGEIENAEREGRQINFKGQSSLKDKKAQSKYNQEWEQYNIEKAGIKDYNLNLLKEAGISPEEYVKKYGEFKYGGLHKFVGGGPTDCNPGYYWNGKACVKDYGNPLYQNNVLNKGSLYDQKVVNTEKKGMAYQTTADELNRLYAQKAQEKAQEKARQDAIRRKAANQKQRDALAKQQLLEQEFNSQINPNKTYSETIGTVAGNAGVPQTQLARELQIGAKEEYYQKRKFVTDNYLNTNRDALINEAARSIQSSSNLTYDQALAKAKQDEALLYTLAEKHTPTDSEHLANVANSQDFYDHKNSRNNQINSFDPNDPEYVSFENPGTIGGYIEQVKNTILNPLDAAHYAMSNETMPFNYSKYEKMKKLNAFTDSSDDNAIMEGLDFASWFNPVGMFAQGVKMVKPTAESILEVYNEPTWANAGTAAFNVGMNALSFVGAKGPLKFLAEENAAANAAREAEAYDFGSRMTRFNRENYTGPQYSEEPIKNSLLLGPSNAPVSNPPLNAGPLLLPIGTTNEVRSTVGSGIGSTPLLNTGTIGFNPIISLNDVYNNIATTNRTTLSRFIPEQNIASEPTLLDTETDLFLNQSEPYQEYQAAVNASITERTNIANAIEAERKAETISVYEAARAEQQAANTNYLQNPSSQDAFMRNQAANNTLNIAEENLSLFAPDYISQPYISSSANLNAYDPSVTIPGATTGTGGVTVYGTTGNTQPVSSVGMNAISNPISATPTPPRSSTAFDALSQALGTSSNNSINYSRDTLSQLTTDLFINNRYGTTIETQLSSIDDPVEYANRLRELYSDGNIYRATYDQLSEGLIAHLDNTSNPTMLTDAAIDIINSDPDALYTGSNLSETDADNWVSNTPSYMLNDALSYYGYSTDDIARFMADPNLSNDVRRVAFNQIKDDYIYMTDFNIRNPNARPITFETGQIVSPALKKTNMITDYRSLILSKKSKDILNKTMYKDLDLTTGSVSFLGTENKTIFNIVDKKNIVSNKDLDKQLEAYEEAYAAVKGKGGRVENLIQNKLEDLRGTKYLRTIYADQMRAEGKDPSEIMKCSIITDERNSKSLLDGDGIVLGSVNFNKADYNGIPYNKIGATGVKIKYHSHSLKHSKVKTWEEAKEVLTKGYLDDLLGTVEEKNRKNPIVIKHFKRQAETQAAETIKQLEINNNNKFGEALYAGASAALKDTRGPLATKEDFIDTNLPDLVTGERITRPRAKNAWASWGKNFYEGVPRAGYIQGPSKDLHDYQRGNNWLRSPNFILRKLGGDVSKLSKFIQ